MKKTILTLLLLFSAFYTFSQIKAGSILFSIDGNYTKTSADAGTMSNLTFTDGKYLITNPMIGYTFTDHFVFGMGVKYIWSKEKRMNRITIDDNEVASLTSSKANALLPGIYMGYYGRVTNKLYFNTNLKVSYGKVNTETFNLYKSNYEIHSYETDISAGNSWMGNSFIDSKNDLFIAELCPEFTYFISPTIGLCLGLGGVEYSVIGSNSETSNWNVSFDPNHWRFCLKINI